MKRMQSQQEHSMSTKIFVNVSVKNLERTKAFFSKLGYAFNPQFTSDDAACMVISEDIFAMLLTETHFKQFTPKPIADASKTTETIIALSAPSKEAVIAIVEKAFDAGAKRYAEASDHGFMYQWGFEDLDGHIWEYAWMDPAAVQK
jgi:predicted lactoylglutathione lyase